jgi:hypothetical protein
MSSRIRCLVGTHDNAVSLYCFRAERLLSSLAGDFLTTVRSQTQSQSYFTTGGLPPINSSRCHAPWKSRSDYFFFFATAPLRPYSLRNTLSDERLGLSLMNMLGLVKCTYRTYSMLLKILACALYISPLSVQVSQSGSSLPYLSLATTAA